MDYRQFVALFDVHDHSSLPNYNVTTCSSPSSPQPCLPCTEAQYVGYLTLLQHYTCQPSNVVIFTNSPLYILYLLFLMPADAYDLSALPYWAQAYWRLIGTYCTETHKSPTPEQYYDFLAYDASIEYNTLAVAPFIRHHFRTTAAKPDAIKVTLNNMHLSDRAINIVTFDRLDILVPSDFRAVLSDPKLAANAVLNFSRTMVCLTVIAEEVVPMFVSTTLERFLYHPNIIEPPVVVSPDTHDYCHPERWIVPDKYVPLDTFSTDSPQLLVCLVFPSGASLGDPVSSSYVHRELLGLKNQYSIEEYIVMCLTVMFLARDARIRIMVDCQWLRKRGVYLFDDVMTMIHANTTTPYLAIVGLAVSRNLAVDYLVADDSMSALSRQVTAWNLFTTLVRESEPGTSQAKLF